MNHNQNSSVVVTLALILGILLGLWLGGGNLRVVVEHRYGAAEGSYYSGSYYDYDYDTYTPTEPAGKESP